MPALSSRGRATVGRDNQAKPRSDAYTGLLLLSLLAQVAGAVFLFLDYSRYPNGAPPKPAALSASAGGPSAPAPAVPPPTAPVPPAPR
jgi:hypothetical protein